MPDRQPVPEDTQVSVLTKSRRRCALCFGLKGDLEEKKGQIAHLDQNRNNNKEENLAFLCFDHHDTYDSKTSQSKGFTKKEVSYYRENLYTAIETALSIRPALPENTSPILAHDIDIFQKSEIIMNEIQLSNLLYDLRNSDSFKYDQIEPLDLYVSYFRYSSNYFINLEISESIKPFLKSIEKLSMFLATHFFFDNNYKSVDNPRYCLYPELKYENPVFYEKKAKELDEILHDVKSAYKNFRLLIKSKLFI